MRGLTVRSGSLANGNQLNALQRPRVLSSLETNPVRGAAAEWCHQWNEQIPAETPRRCRHGDNRPGRGFIWETRRTPGTMRRTQKNKKERESSNVFLEECVRKEGKKKWTNKEESVWKEGNAPSSSGALSNPGGSVGGCCALSGSASKLSGPGIHPIPQHTIGTVSPRITLVQWAGTPPS